jgi:hypothetical protein
LLIGQFEHGSITGTDSHEQTFPIGHAEHLPQHRSCRVEGMFDIDRFVLRPEQFQEFVSMGTTADTAEQNLE